MNVTRQPGDPNDQAECTMLKVDMLAPGSYAYDVQYTPFPGEDSGSNPTWIIISPWREPTTPGHGTVTYKHDFDVSDPSTWNQAADLPTLESDLLDGGQGAKIGFEATATDGGTDDLAFLWTWGDATPYGLHVHHDDEHNVVVVARLERMVVHVVCHEVHCSEWRSLIVGSLVELGIREPYVLWVGVFALGPSRSIVMDDDVNEDYPSFFGHPGTTMEFIDLDLRGY